jgi:aminopeptidase N
VFRATMHDFVNSYRLEAATTEDFKAVVERHMSRQMDLDRSQRLDWFFNEYVYGTDLPNYHFESQLEEKGGATSLHFALTQSAVPAGFKMLVPIYVELTSGKVIYLGSVAMVGNKTVDQTVEVPKLASPIKRALINYYYDVLSTEN